MKKSFRLEIAVLGLTAVFILFSAGYFLFHRSLGGVFTVETQAAPAAAAPANASQAPEATPSTAAHSGGNPAAEPAESEVRPSSPASQTPAADAAVGKLNLNTATEAQLESLPGIGPARAAKIVAYRTKHGKFASIRDIMKVSGIKEGIFAEIEDYITVN